jgi:hypothetical protein
VIVLQDGQAVDVPGGLGMDPAAAGNVA